MHQQDAVQDVTHPVRMCIPDSSHERCHNDPGRDAIPAQVPSLAGSHEEIPASDAAPSQSILCCPSGCCDLLSGDHSRAPLQAAAAHPSPLHPAVTARHGTTSCVVQQQRCRATCASGSRNPSLRTRPRALSRQKRNSDARHITWPRYPTDSMDDVDVDVDGRRFANIPVR